MASGVEPFPPRDRRNPPEKTQGGYLTNEKENANTLGNKYRPNPSLVKLETPAIRRGLPDELGGYRGQEGGVSVKHFYLSLF